MIELYNFRFQIKIQFQINNFGFLNILLLLKLTFAV